MNTERKAELFDKFKKANDNYYKSTEKENVLSVEELQIRFDNIVDRFEPLFPNEESTYNAVLECIEDLENPSMVDEIYNEYTNTGVQHSTPREVSNIEFDGFINKMVEIVDVQRIATQAVVDSVKNSFQNFDFDSDKPIELPDTILQPMQCINVADSKGGVGYVISLEEQTFIGENVYEITYMTTIGIPRTVTISKEDMLYDSNTSTFLQIYAEHFVSFSLSVVYQLHTDE